MLKRSGVINPYSQTMFSPTVGLYGLAGHLS